MTKPSWIGSRQYIDKPFWILFIVLIIFAILALFSAGSTLAYKPDNTILSPILKQVLFIAAGVGLAYGIQLLPTKFIRIIGYPIWLFAWICVVVIIIPGNHFVAELNDAERWMNLFGFRFQPSEIAKLGLIMVVADQLARIKNEEDARKRFLWTLGITLATCFPIMVANLSTAVLLAGVVFLMWILARIPGKYLCITGASAIVAAVLVYFVIKFCFIKPHRDLPSLFGRAETHISRIDTYLGIGEDPDKEVDLLDKKHYQRSIAKVAVWRGGKTPFGVLPGNSKERDILPFAYADYIFAIIVEETGVIGALLLIFLYLAILFRACYASSKYTDFTAMLMTMGLALMITCQAFVSMAVAVGLGPVTGQPLPMITKGGTSAIVTSIYFGIMMCVAREQNELRSNVNQSVRESQEETPIIDLNS